MGPGCAHKFIHDMVSGVLRAGTHTGSGIVPSATEAFAGELDAIAFADVSPDERSGSRSTSAWDACTACCNEAHCTPVVESASVPCMETGDNQASLDGDTLVSRPAGSLDGDSCSSKGLDNSFPFVDI